MHKSMFIDASFFKDKLAYIHNPIYVFTYLHTYLHNLIYRF